MEEKLAKLSGIYKIQSVINSNKIYIGSSININTRWSRHLSDLQFNRHPNKKLQNHFNVYGIKDLKFSVLVECDKYKLIELEQYFIDSYNPWFNIRIIAESNLCYKFSDETKKKMSLAKIGKRYPPRTEEQRKNSGRKKGCIPWNKGKKTSPMSEEQKNKISMANKGRSKNKGVKRSEEFKQNLSKIKMGVIATEKARENMRIAWVERKRKKLLLED